MKRWIMAACGLALGALTTWAEAVQVQAARMWTAPDHTRFVLDLSRPVDYRVFRLHAPERIVLDLRKSRLRADLARLPVPDPVVARVRWGRPERGVLRIVLDVKEEVRPRSFLLRPMRGRPWRLVVDLLRRAEERTITKPAGVIVVAVDAGHGGEDPGAIGPHGIREKDITLAVAKRLARLIDATPGMKAVLIRRGDYFIPLRRRVQLARRAHADLFISIHADSVRDRHVAGASVYLLSERGATPDREAEALAAKENASDLVGGEPPEALADPTVRAILGDMLSRATLDASGLLAREILGELARTGPIKYREPKRARFVVLTALEMPSVLVELDYLSNPRRERLLARARHQKRLARAILAGVQRFARRMGMWSPPGKARAEAFPSQWNL